jgi:hypothetical protein
MIARSDHKVDRQFPDVALFAIEAELILALVVSAIALEHREVSVGGPMIIGVGGLVVFDFVGWLGTIERASHPGAAVGFPHVRVTTGAHLRFDIRILRLSLSRWNENHGHHGANDCPCHALLHGQILLRLGVQL